MERCHRTVQEGYWLGPHVFQAALTLTLIFRL